MPCGMYDDRRPDSVQSLRTEVARLTKENDELRETVLALTTDSEYVIPDVMMKTIKQDQIKHRKEDLARLKKTFKNKRDATRLGLVMLATPNLALEPQLGFNPDDY